MAAGKWTPSWKRLENLMFRVVWFLRYVKTKFNWHNTYVVRVVLFNGNNIHMPGVAVTTEINLANKKWK